MVKAALLASVGAACLIRGLFRPIRALAKSGEIRRCAGTNAFGVCDPSMGIAVAAGASVYSALCGQVVAVGEDYLHVLAEDEPVIVMYQGVAPSVRLGQFLGSGQSVGTSLGDVNFSVTQMGPGGMSLIEPASWLAARGFKVLLNNTGPAHWCAQGRHISVPASARQKCDLRRPEGASFALLPVSVEMN